MQVDQHESTSRAQADACIVCGRKAWRPHFAALRRCDDCGFVCADGRWSADEIQELYSARYFTGEEYGDYLAEADSHRRNCDARWHEISKAATDLESVFEVGCAYGFWLEYVRHKGVRCAGIDVCAEAVTYATDTLGQDAVAGDFLALPLEPGQFQAFCMWDTVEHLPRPDLFLARIAELLPPGGWFFATTGDIGSRSARWRGPRWRMIHPPTHLHYFSSASMRQFLEGFGLHVRRIHSVPIYRNMRAVLANLQVLGGPAARLAARLVDRLTPRALQERLGAWIDLGDIMLVCAQKP